MKKYSLFLLLLALLTSSCELILPGFFVTEVVEHRGDDDWTNVLIADWTREETGDIYASDFEFQISESGVIFLAYSSTTNDGRLSILMCSNSNWTLLSESLSASPVSSFSLALSGETPYLAYTDTTNSNRATVLTYNGSWQIIGAEAFTPRTAASLSLAVLSNQPYLAFSDRENNFGINVMTYTGSWETVDDVTNQTALTVSSVNLRTDGSSLYLAFQDSYFINSARALRYDGSWVSLGATNGITETAAGDLKMELFAGEPYLLFRDVLDSMEATLIRYNGSWSTFGSTIGEGGFTFSDLAFSATSPYVVVGELSNSGKASVLTYQNDAWTNLGSVGFSSSLIDGAQIEIFDGTAYVGFIDTDGTLALLKCGGAI